MLGLLSLWRGDLKRRPSLALLTTEFAQAYGYTVAELRGQGRTQPLADHRQHLMLILREKGRRSYPAIGRYLGGRDHTTIIYGVRAARTKGFHVQ